MEQPTEILCPAVGRRPWDAHKCTTGGTDGADRTQFRLDLLLREIDSSAHFQKLRQTIQS